jgi:rare lipoprotein A
MINRALKAFPCMVFTVLLASPALAATGSGHSSRHNDNPEPERRAHATEPRVSERRAAISRTALSSVSRAGGRVTTATRSRRGYRSYAEGRAAPSREAFVNDATAWSEPGVDLNASYGGGIVRGGAITQVGLASWYGGGRWQGNRMSNGSRFDESQLTAAHATLPLGSKVLVSLAGGARSVIVTITDRPGTRRRIIDLSRAAAAELGILERGVAQVSLTAL